MAIDETLYAGPHPNSWMTNPTEAKYSHYCISDPGVVTLIREVLPQQKPVSAAAKPLGSVSLFFRLVFLAQDGARLKLKICPEPSGNKLSESFL